MNTKLKDLASISSIVSEMSVDEKVVLITGYSSFTTQPMEKFGIPSCRLLDGGTGVNLFQYYGDLLALAQKTDANNATSLTNMSNSFIVLQLLNKTDHKITLTDKEKQIQQIINAEISRVIPSVQLPSCFPPGIMLGATWDPESVYLCANAVAREMDVYKVDVVLGSPNINIHRDPLNGRVFEGYSEDPYLAAKLAPEFVKGIQDEGIIANVKHFAANNQESYRQNINEIISLRALYEIYFPGFESCVRKGKVKSVMSAYNGINGKPCAMNKWLLTEVLRDEWKYEGIVISDWGAAYDQAAAIAAGNDLSMPGPRSIEPVVSAVNSGSLKMQELDSAVTNMLKMILDTPTMKGRKNTTIDYAYSRYAAYKAASEGCVLLKNKNKLLPLSYSTNVSFIGKRCNQFIESGGGSAMVHTDQSTSMVNVTISKIGKENVTYKDDEHKADAIIITVAAWGQEGCDRKLMDIEADDKQMLLAAISEAKQYQQRIILILNISGPVDMHDYIDDLDAIICVFFPGQEGGRVVSDIIFGDINPSGKLPLTFPRQYLDCPTFGNFPGCVSEVCYGEGIFVGYRYYESRNVQPLFPFGFGLSYSNFRIYELELSSSQMNMDIDEKITVSVKIKNISNIGGKEVVQLYIRDVKSTLIKPFKELKDFRKVFVEAGEVENIIFQVSKDQLKSYDTTNKQWVTEAGTYEILVGNCSDNISVSASFIASGYSLYNYNAETMLTTLYDDERAKNILECGMQEFGIDPNDLSDCLYYFPHRAIGKVLKRLCNNVDDRSNKEKNDWCKGILDRLHKLDLSLI